MQFYLRNNRFTRGLKAASLLAVLTVGQAASATTAPKAPVMAQPDVVYDYQDQFLANHSSSAFDSALEFVNMAGITKNLSLLLLQDIKKDSTVQSAIPRLGMDAVQSRVIAAIRAAQKRHQGKWNEVLANIYSQHFTTRELRSIMTERETSPHFLTMLQLQETISEAVRTEGQAVFVQAKADVLGTLNVTFAQ